jgi:capsular polysaccharide biosynthesis protein
MAKQLDPNRISGAITPPSAVLPARRSIADDVLHALRTRWDVVAVITFSTALMAWGLSAIQPKVYRASAIAALTTAQGLTPADQIRGVQALEQSTFVATVAAMAATPVITTRAIPPGGDRYSMRAVVLPNTNLLRIEVDGADVNRAAQIANGVAPLLSAEAKKIFGIYGVTAVSPASSGELVSPRTGRITAVGVVIGLLLGTTVAWAMARPRVS